LPGGLPSGWKAPWRASKAATNVLCLVECPTIDPISYLMSDDLDRGPRRERHGRLPDRPAPHTPPWATNPRELGAVQRPAGRWASKRMSSPRVTWHTGQYAALIPRHDIPHPPQAGRWWQNYREAPTLVKQHEGLAPGSTRPELVSQGPMDVGLFCDLGVGACSPRSPTWEVEG
jgi:hypothetical protein